MGHFISNMSHFISYESFLESNIAYIAWKDSLHHFMATAERNLKRHDDTSDLHTFKTNGIMKKTFLFASIMAIAMMGCGSGGGTESKGLKTDSVKFEQNTKESEVKIVVDYPTAGDPVMVNAIAEYVNENLGGTYYGDLQKSDSLLAYYGNTIEGKLKEEYDDVGDNSRPPYSFSMDIRKIYETDRTVTFTASSYSYMGGAHGMGTNIGKTFRKSDGRRFCVEMMCNVNTDEFRNMIKERLRTYFKENGENVTTDDELAEMLITESGLDFLPLPQYDPYLTKDGVKFVYQQYEIAPYAAGLPSFTIPYDKVWPYLTQEGRNMIER